MLFHIVGAKFSLVLLGCDEFIVTFISKII